MQLMDAIFKDLQTTIKSIVIKYENKAKLSETTDSRRMSDLYLSAAQDKDTFNTYQSFDIRAYNNAGINDTDLIDTYENDKYQIPREIRDRLVAEQRKLLIDEFEEQNNYYRMLMGLPDIEDMAYIYLDEEKCIELGLDPNVPIHEYTRDQLTVIINKGYLEPIITQYPNKSYLKYMGENSINIIRARNARNFAILKMTNDVSDTFNEEFNTIYDQSREYFMSVIYNKNYGSQYAMYDNFISMMIMIMTIQRLISNTFKYGIEYDFYDLGSIKMVFDAYNVPFIASVPVDYQRTLIRNLNNLLRYKSTDKVLYDICSLLGLDGVKLFKYFLFKEHRFDNEGKPIFEYKELDDGNGNIEIVEDSEAMYKLFFQSVELNERNTALALADHTNILDYKQVVLDDPWWWDEDEELYNTLYESEFNYVESKYLSMNMMYKLTQMLFEVTYVFNMLLDKKSEIRDLITVQLPRMFEDKDIDLFDFTCLLCALISKKTNMAGNIIHSPSKILSVMGFNFSADFAAIRQELTADKNVDPKVLAYLQNLSITSSADVNRLYGNIRDLNDFLVDRMARTQNLKEYRIYRKLYNAIYVTEHMNTLFTKRNGEVAETFLEYLEDRDVVLYNFVVNVEVDKIGDFVNHMLIRLNNMVKDLKYLNIVTDANSVLLEAAITLIRFFKSYTTDLASFNVLYLLDSRYFNMIRMIHTIKSIDKNLQYNDIGLLRNYKTSLHYTATLTNEEMLNIIEDPWFYINMTEKDVMNLAQNINSFKVQDRIKKILYLKDNFASFVNNLFRENLKLEDWKFVTTTIYRQDKKMFTDMVKDMVSNIDTRDIELLRLVNHIDGLLVNEQYSDVLKYMDDKSFVSSIKVEDPTLAVHDDLSIKQNLVNKDLMTTFNSIIENIYKISRYKDKCLNLKDSMDSFYQMDFMDKSLKLSDKHVELTKTEEFNEIVVLEEKVLSFIAEILITEYSKPFDKLVNLTKVDLLENTIKMEENMTSTLNDEQRDELSLRYATYLSSLNKQILNNEGVPLQDKLVLQWEK